MDEAYRSRVVDGVLSGLLQHRGAVLIEGARACGKSATGRHHARSGVQLDIDANALRMAEIDPGRLLEGASPRFIDEWQLAPALWNHVRAAVDRDAEASFILAGSAVPSDDRTRHSGAGRILRLRMRPMALVESGHSSGEVSLGALLASGADPVVGESPLRVEDLVEASVRGGWPGLLTASVAHAMSVLGSYLDDVARVDLARLDGEPPRDPSGVLRLIRALGRRVATESNVAALAREISAGDAPMAEMTVRAYLTALERVFVVEEQPSWAPHLRSRDRVRKAAKLHFVDPSLAVAALGAGPDRLLSDLEYFGQVFESLAVRDLRVLAGASDATVTHYRDSAGREVDAIVERRDGSWIAVEVKLAAAREDEAAASLHRFRSALDPERTADPAALVVLTGGRYAYTREDGVHVVPIGTLGP